MSLFNVTNHLSQKNLKGFLARLDRDSHTDVIHYTTFLLIILTLSIHLLFVTKKNIDTTFLAQLEEPIYPLNDYFLSSIVSVLIIHF
jgi:hypothetical protein